MKIKNLLTKTLLVAAGLLVGASNAWAGATTVYSNDFETSSDWTAKGKTDGWGVNPGTTTANTFSSNVIGIGAAGGDRGLVSPSMSISTSIVDVSMKFKMDACTSGKSSGIEFITSDVNINNGYVSSGTPFFSIAASANGNGYWGTISVGGNDYTSTLNQTGTFENNSLNRNTTGIVVLDVRFDFTAKTATFILKNTSGTTLVASTTVAFANAEATTLDRIFIHAGKTYGGVTIDDVTVVSRTAPDFTLSSTAVTPSVGGNSVVTVSDITGSITSVTSEDESIATASITDNTITINGIASGVTNIVVTATNDGVTTTKNIAVTVGDVATTTVTVNYKYGEESIASSYEIADVAVGSTLTESDVPYDAIVYGTGCRYVSPTLSPTLPYTVVENGVITVTYATQQASVSSLDVKAVVNATNYAIKTIDLDSKYVGDAVDYTYPEYYLLDETLYSAEKYSSSSYYKGSYTLDGNANTISYGTTAASNVVYYSEGESISGATASSSSNADIRCSDGKGGYFESETNIVTLPAGVYTIYTQVWGGSGTAFTFTAGGNTIHTNTTTGSLTSANSSFTLAEQTTIKISAVGSSSKVLDFVYIVKTGDLPATENIVVTDAGFATYVSSYNLDFTSATTKAYKVSVAEKGVAVMTEVAKVPAGTPVLLYKDGGNGEGEAIPVTSDAVDAVTGNDLVAGTGATVATIDDTYTNMILNNGASGIGFYLAAGQTVAANRAYLHIATSLAPSGAPMMLLFADDMETTGISDVRSKTEDVRGDFFDLSGRRVAQPTKGLYIVNGKKVLVP